MAMLTSFLEKAGYLCEYCDVGGWALRHGSSVCRSPIESSDAIFSPHLLLSSATRMFPQLRRAEQPAPAHPGLRPVRVFVGRAHAAGNGQVAAR
jgi:hypothetical protein